jgi:hypothetical protein
MARNPLQRLPRKSNGPDQIDRRYRLTPCSQSQIGGDRHLRSWGAGQVEGAVALSVVVRSGPIITAVNSTVVARPEDNLGKACRCWVHLDHRVRAVRGNHGCMGKPLQTARQLFRMPSGRGRMGRWLRRPGEHASGAREFAAREQSRIYLPLFSASAIRDSIKAPILRAFRRATR